ncbi:protein of unknown function [Bradyrhizobium sp. ORS 285]|nr:hypothetical protein BRAO285_1110031 [Bradyrhizobium sp. ORS 285]SMX57124.1 protein of unknown function [Bradyrhizobium sp. ORS 285]
MMRSPFTHSRNFSHTEATTPMVVMRGLDPRIHPLAKAPLALDRRVKPGDDEQGLGQLRMRLRMTAPSPLVGEGISAGRHERGQVRGLSPLARPRREPLTRLRYAQPPSPTRGEGYSVPAS